MSSNAKKEKPKMSNNEKKKKFGEFTLASIFLAGSIYGLVSSSKTTNADELTIDKSIKQEMKIDTPDNSKIDTQNPKIDTKNSKNALVRLVDDLFEKVKIRREQVIIIKGDKLSESTEKISGDVEYFTEKAENIKQQLCHMISNEKGLQQENIQESNISIEHLNPNVQKYNTEPNNPNAVINADISTLKTVEKTIQEVSNIMPENTNDRNIMELMNQLNYNNLVNANTLKKENAIDETNYKELDQEMRDFANKSCTIAQKVAQNAINNNEVELNEENAKKIVGLDAMDGNQDIKYKGKYLLEYIENTFEDIKPVNKEDRGMEI